MTEKIADLHESIGQRLHRERVRLAYTEAAFGELCGHSATSVTEWEVGVAHPSAAALACLARHAVDVLYVLTGECTRAAVKDELDLGMGGS
jgi:DNA-binding transcriptional regulator YiaG